MYKCMCICMCVFECIYIYTYTHIYLLVYAYIYTYLRVYSCIYINIYACMHKYLPVHIHAYGHTYFHTYIHMDIYVAELQCMLCWRQSANNQTTVPRMIALTNCKLIAHTPHTAITNTHQSSVYTSTKILCIQKIPKRKTIHTRLQHEWDQEKKAVL